MIERRKLNRVLERLETEKDWKLFNALTDQGRKLVSDSIEVWETVQAEDQFNKYMEEKKRDPNFIIWGSLKLMKWAIFLTGVYTIISKFQFS